MRAELDRRESLTDRVEAWFLAHPREWIRAIDLEPIGGRQGWRTRVSESRRRLKARGYTIENRIRKDSDGLICSEYRLTWLALGRAAETFMQPSLLEGEIR